jgi:hypothetical protein
MMLITLVAVLCNGLVCIERVVTNSDQSDISIMTCALHGQAVIAETLSSGLYPGFHVQSYRCVIGQYQPRRSA